MTKTSKPLEALNALTSLCGSLYKSSLVMGYANQQSEKVLSNGLNSISPVHNLIWLMNHCSDPEYIKKIVAYAEKLSCGSGFGSVSLEVFNESLKQRRSEKTEYIDIMRDMIVKDIPIKQAAPDLPAATRQAITKSAKSFCKLVHKEDIDREFKTQYLKLVNKYCPEDICYLTLARPTQVQKNIDYLNDKVETVAIQSRIIILCYALDLAGDELTSKLLDIYKNQMKKIRGELDNRSRKYWVDFFNDPFTTRVLLNKGMHAQRTFVHIDELGQFYKRILPAKKVRL